ncbi:serine hydroxymethyltransferase [Jannaschia sp. LMIT008]|uniref:serine hydroxymethyltransferase n=1 Tax=Jannaschia maritima TaxID=3032585 RepID=UPI0028110045|nr:aminotransferase class I/II-fold pyridoxal phosphate-dependent enzyme [Jannaschia sp. LMIT008]
MTTLARRGWVPDGVELLVRDVACATAEADAAAVARRIAAAVERNRAIHDEECFNLNPAANVMNPAAEALLASGLGTRPSLGYPGEKYEMGLEGVEEVEIVAAALAAEIFDAAFAEIRVGSGALANLYAFMAVCRPGDAVIVPPAAIGGHVTHHAAGCAGLYGLAIHEAPVDADGYTVDPGGLRDLVRDVRPRMITVGGSLNLFPHPTGAIREIADTVGATVLFDAAHQCGMIAGRAWPNPLDEGAHLMTMSTYKSLGGPAGGLIVTRDADLAERLDRIAFPGLTANFDAGRVAALAMALLDWRTFGRDYAAEMVAVSQALAEALAVRDLPVFETPRGRTESHQFAMDAAPFGGGQRMARHLREAGLLTCGIGLPRPPVAGDMNGLRFGTPEIVRRGVGAGDVAELATLVADGLRADDPARVAPRTARMRRRFTGLRFVRS